MLDDLEGWMKERGAKSIQVHSEDFFRGNVYHNMTGIVFSRGIVMHRIFCRSCTELRPDDIKILGHIMYSWSRGLR
jgi:hypothetical protein